MKDSKKFIQLAKNKSKMSTTVFLSVAFMVLFSNSTFAQNGSAFGVKFGLNYGGNGDYFESTADNFDTPENNLGYHIGVFGKIGDRIYFRPEVVYTKTKSAYNAGDFNLQKIDAPLLVGLKIIGPVSVFAGPSLQFILDSEFENFDTDRIKNELSVGFNFGIALNFNTIEIDLRYERGFNDNEATFIDNNNLANSDRLDIRPEQLILSLSIKI